MTRIDDPLTTGRNVSRRGRWVRRLRSTGRLIEASQTIDDLLVIGAIEMCRSHLQAPSETHAENGARRLAFDREACRG